MTSRDSRLYCSGCIATLPLFLVGLLLKILLTPESALAGPIAKLLKVSGQAKVQRADQMLSAGKDFELEEGDRLSTERESSAVLILRDKSLLFVEADSSLEMSKSQIRPSSAGTISIQIVELVRGKIAASVQKQNSGDQFLVRTKTLNMGVRGTKFLVSTNGESSVVVSEGEVIVASRQTKGDEVIVTEGEMATVKATGGEVESQPVTEVVMQSLTGIFDSMRYISMTASVEVLEFTKRATIAALQVMEDAGRQTMTTVESGVLQVRDLGLAAISLVDDELQQVIARRKIAFANFAAYLPPAKLRSSTKPLSGIGFGVRSMGPAVRGGWTFDRSIDFALLGAETRDTPEPLKMRVWEGGISGYWARGIPSISLEPSVVIGARMRRWNLSRDVDVADEGIGDLQDKDLTFAPIGGIGLLYPISNNLVLQLESISAYWLGNASGLDVGVRTGLGFKF